MTKAFTEGTITFSAPGTSKKCSTWYKAFGDLTSPTGPLPLIILHGGPGGAHDYMLELSSLHEHFSIPVIFYDQIGCGRSTHLRERNGDEGFWTPALFIAELDNVIDHFGLRERGFDILGHSWGGMLAGEYASSRPRGLRRLIISSGLASIELFLKGANRLRAQLPRKDRDALDKAGRSGNFDTPEFAAAMDEFSKRHLCRITPYPSKELKSVLDNVSGDPTVFGTMFGASDLFPTGGLRNWSSVDGLHKITAPTLLINGRYDEVQQEPMQPYFDLIPRVRWATLEKSSHFGHVEERDRHLEIVSRFLLAD